MQNTENKFKYDGAIYVASEIAVISCRGCSFEYDDMGCGKAQSCHADERQDNRNVIFIESDADNFGDEK